MQAVDTKARGGAGANPRRVHLAHATFVGLHALCCLGPLALAALGAIGGAALLAGVGLAHDFIHARELWIIGASVAFVAAGYALERRSGRKPSRLFFASAACMGLNVAAVAMHQAGILG